MATPSVKPTSEEMRRTELCTKPPRFDEDLVVETDAMTLARWHVGEIEWNEALRLEQIRVFGPRDLARALSSWNLSSTSRIS